MAPLGHVFGGAIKACWVCALVLLSLSCASPTRSLNGGLVVHAAPPVLELTNQSPSPVYYFAVERETASLIKWAPCADPSRCEHIALGASASSAYPAITGYAPGAREAIVYWWHLVPGPTGLQPDQVRSVVVAL